MLDIQFKNIDIAKIQKNNLYKISTSMVVPFVEEHEKSREKVLLHYKLMDGQFGIYATEYRAPVVIKKGCKTTDILACVVYENQRKLYTLIADVKSNISFSELKEDFVTDYDQSGTIGKRYRRADEIGTPFCVTVDHDTKEDGTVTIRFRDSMEQVRVQRSELVARLHQEIKNYKRV